MPDPQSFDASMAAASGAGALASVVANRSLDTTLRKLGDGLIGALVGVWCGPGIADALGLERENWRIAAAFAVGGTGMILFTGLLDLVKSKAFRDWMARLVEKRP